MMLSDAGLSMMTALRRTFCHSASTGCALLASGTPTTNVVGTRPDEGGTGFVVGEAGDRRLHDAADRNRKRTAGIGVPGRIRIGDVQYDERRVLDASGSVRLRPGIGVKLPELVECEPWVCTYRIIKGLPAYHRPHNISPGSGRLLIFLSRLLL